MKRFFALMLVGGLMALGCGPAPSTQKSTPPATTAPAAGTGTEKSMVPADKKGTEKKGDEKGGE